MIDQKEMFDIANPCRGICEVNNKGYCKGCLRKREERFHWNEFTPFQKQLIVNLCGRRRAKAIAAKQQAEWQAKYGMAEHGIEEQTVDIPQLDMFVEADSQQDIQSAEQNVQQKQEAQQQQNVEHPNVKPQSETSTPQNQPQLQHQPQPTDQFDLF